MKEIGMYDINTYLDYKMRLNCYKNAGFSEIGLYIDENYMQNGESYVDIIEFARQIGLGVRQVHVDYKISNLICDEEDQTYFDYVDEKMKECALLKIPYMVLHASKGDNPPVVSPAQIDKLVSVARKYPEVTLCFENVRNNKNLELILKADCTNIKMCFDLGHAHAYANEYDLFEKYKDKIVCAHIHNNFKEDTHNPPNEGEMDCKFFVDKLSKIKNISICLECFPKREEEMTEEKFGHFVQTCFQSI